MDVLQIILAATLVIGVTGFWRIIRHRRARDGYQVDGQITYLEGKTSHKPLLTFSYTADGKRFHTSWEDTLDYGQDSKLRCAALRYSVGDTIKVWCARRDPAQCRIDGLDVQYAVMTSVPDGKGKRIPEYRVKCYCLFGLGLSLLFVFAGWSQVRETLRTLRLVHDSGRSRHPVLEHVSWEDNPVWFVLYAGQELLMLAMAGLATAALLWRIVRGRKAFGQWL